MENLLVKNLKYLRKKYNLKQSYLSTRLGVSRTTITNYESGLSKPDAPATLVLARLFNVTPEQIMSSDLTSNDISTFNPYLFITDFKDGVTPEQGLTLINFFANMAVWSRIKNENENLRLTLDAIEDIEDYILRLKNFLDTYCLEKANQVNKNISLANSSDLLRKTFIQKQVEILLPLTEYLHGLSIFKEGMHESVAYLNEFDLKEVMGDTFPKRIADFPVSLKNVPNSIKKKKSS